MKGENMRRAVVGAIVVAMLVGGGALPASAVSVQTPAGGGVVSGTAFGWGTSTHSYRIDYDLSFAGSVPVGETTYVGAFTISGTTSDIVYTPPYYLPCPPSPYCELGLVPAGWIVAPFTGDLALSGSNAAGDVIAGTCGEPGSQISNGPGLQLYFTVPYWTTKFVCSAAVDGGLPQQVSVTMLGGLAPPTTAWPEGTVTAVFTS
jgi:hypothetical protein